MTNSAPSTCKVEHNDPKPRSHSVMRSATLFLFSVFFGMGVSLNAHPEEPGDIFLRNVHAAGTARSCGQGKMEQQLKSVTMQYYSLHPELLDLSRISDAFDERVALIRQALGDARRSGTLCETKLLSYARDQILRTQKLIPPEQIISSGDTPALLNEMLMECNSDAIEVGESIFSAKRSGETKSQAITRFERDEVVWPTKSVTAIYARAISAHDAGNTSKQMCVTEISARLLRLR